MKRLFRFLLSILVLSFLIVPLTPSHPALADSGCNGDVFTSKSVNGNDYLLTWTVASGDTKYLKSVLIQWSPFSPNHLNKLEFHDQASGMTKTIFGPLYQPYRMSFDQPVPAYLLYVQSMEMWFHNNPGSVVYGEIVFTDCTVHYDFRTP